MPLIYDLTNLNIGLDIKNLLHYRVNSFTLVSKIPTLALKDIHIISYCFFIVRHWHGFIALLFYTLKRFIFGIIYLLSIPVSVMIYNNHSKKIRKISDDNHEDIL